jgi:hypothetical protein
MKTRFRFRKPSGRTFDPTAPIKSRQYAINIGQRRSMAFLPQAVRAELWLQRRRPRVRRKCARLRPPGALQEVVSLSGVDRLRCQHGREAGGNYREIASLIAVMQVRHSKTSIDITPERCNPIIASPPFSLAIMYSSTGVQQLCTNLFLLLFAPNRDFTWMKINLPQNTIVMSGIPALMPLRR